MIKIWTYETKIPSSTDEKEIATLKSVIGKSEVEAYSLGEDYKIIKGKGCIKMNDAYNYHCNTDESEEAMFFNNKELWFTLSEDRIKEVYNYNARLIRESINKKLNEYSEV